MNGQGIWKLISWDFFSVRSKFGLSSGGLRGILDHRATGDSQSRLFNVKNRSASWGMNDQHIRQQADTFSSVIVVAWPLHLLLRYAYRFPCIAVLISAFFFNCRWKSCLAALFPYAIPPYSLGCCTLRSANRIKIALCPFLLNNCGRSVLREFEHWQLLFSHSASSKKFIRLTWGNSSTPRLFPITRSPLQIKRLTQLTVPSFTTPINNLNRMNWPKH